MYNTRPFIGINYARPWTYDRPHTQISALRILPTIPQHLSTVSIPHFTFCIPHSVSYAFYQQPKMVDWWYVVKLPLFKIFVFSTEHIVGVKASYRSFACHQLCWCKQTEANLPICEHSVCTLYFSTSTATMSCASNYISQCMSCIYWLKSFKPLQCGKNGLSQMP